MRISRTESIRTQAGPYGRDLPLEVERKFLLPSAPGWLPRCRVEEIEQGYLAIEADEVEVRLRRLGENRYLTVKRGSGERRAEAEVELSREQFEAVWPLTAGRRLSKARHYVPTDAGEIEVDVYRDALAGLITAEVEFEPASHAGSFDPPDWLGDEVTGDPAFANKNLATRGLPAGVNEPPTSR